MSTYIVKTGYGQAENKKVRIFKVSKTAKLEFRGGAFQRTDFEGQSAEALLRKFPTISCAGAWVQAGPFEVPENPTSSYSADFVDTPDHPVTVKSVQELITNLGAGGVRAIEVVRWAD